MRIKSKKYIGCQESTPVYDLTTISSNHNFSLSNGVIVHNCTGSKDISDAVCACVTTAYENIDLAQELSGSYRAKMQMKLIGDLYDEDTGPSSPFQNMMKGMFGK